MHTLRTLPYLLLLAFLFLAACGQQSPEVATSTLPPPIDEPAPTEAPTEAPVEPATVPTREPTTAPTEAPTAVPTEEPTPTAAPVAERVGILRFTDNETTRLGNFRLELRGVAALPAGSHYQLWLVGDDEMTMKDLGPLTVSGDEILAEGSTDENLLANYSRALISVEADNDSDMAISDEIAFTGLVPAEPLVHIRNAVDEFADNPDGKGFLPGAQEQAELAQQHAGLLQEELMAGNLDGAKLHAEHVINILDGEEGEHFGDFTGDGQAQNPGDGLGVRAYLQGAQAQAEQAAAAPGATNEITLHSGHVVIAGDNALGWLDEAIGEAQHVIASDTVEEATPFGETLVQLLTDLVEGRDLNGDAYAAPAPGEGAILTAYEHGVFMGGFEIFSGEQAATTPAPDATSTPPAEAPTPTPTPVPTEAPPAEVVVDMLDFTYDPLDLVVSVGTTVTWVNVGQFEHSATASDHSWDTGLYGTGEEASITFDTPGTFVYYCTLHGTAEGAGMAATITIEE